MLKTSSIISSIESDANLALAGLEQLAPTILNSGLPEAIILLSATVKCVNSIMSATEDAKRELSTRSF